MLQQTITGKIAMVSGYKSGANPRIALSVQTDTIKSGPCVTFGASIKLILPPTSAAFSAGYYSIPAAVTIADGLESGHSRVTVDMAADDDMWSLLFEHIVEPDVQVEIVELEEKQEDAESLPAPEQSPEVTVDAMVEGKRKRGRPRKMTQSVKDELST